MYYMDERTKKSKISRIMWLGAYVILILGISACDHKQSGKANGNLKTESEGETTPLTERPAAKLDGEVILYSDVRRIALEQGLISPDENAPHSLEAPLSVPMDIADFNIALNRLLDQKLLAKDALLREDHKTAIAKRRLNAARERLLSSIRIEAHIRETVTESAMRELYARQSELDNLGDEIRARHILVETEEDAKKLLTRIEMGEDFDVLAAELSLDVNTRDRGGELGYATFDMLQAEFSRIIFSASPDAAIMPFETTRGWHVAQILDRRSPKVKTYAQSRPALRRYLTFDAIEVLLTELRRDANVKFIEIDLTSPLQPITGSESKFESDAAERLKVDADKTP